MISQLAGLRIRQLTIRLVTLLNLCQQRSLSLGVISTELIGTLKHQVLQIVCQPRRLCRIVLTTRPHGNVCLDTRLLLIHREIHLQSVIQRIDARFHQIALYRLIIILLGLHAHS